MCGWPFVRSGAMQAIAAPVPSPARYEGLPRYCSEFLVREVSGWRSLEETFGHRFGWMAADSQSGFNAPRAHLARFATAQRPPVRRGARDRSARRRRRSRRLRAGEVDVVALDSFFLDLCRHHQPSMLAGLRCVAATPWTPIPLLVAAPGVDGAIVARLRRHLLGIHPVPFYAPLLADVLLQRFVAARRDVVSRTRVDGALRGRTQLRSDSVKFRQGLARFSSTYLTLGQCPTAPWRKD